MAIIIVLACAVVILIAQPSDNGDPASTRAPATPAEKKAERIRRALAKDPGNRKLLLASMRAWIEAGSGRLSGPEGVVDPIPPAVVEDLATGLAAWRRYLREAGGTASVENAEIAGDAYFWLLEIGSTDVGELEADATGAAQALRIAGRQRPDLFTLSNVAVYAYFNGEYAAGDRAARQAAALFDKPSRSAIVTEQLDTSRERAEAFRAQLRQAAARLRETGEEELAEPLRAFASTAGINKEEPPPAAGPR